MVQMANCMLCAFYYNKKHLEKKESGLFQINCLPFKFCIAWQDQGSRCIWLISLSSEKCYMQFAWLLWAFAHIIYLLPWWCQPHLNWEPLGNHAWPAVKWDLTVGVGHCVLMPKASDVGFWLSISKGRKKSSSRRERWHVKNFTMIKIT